MYIIEMVTPEKRVEYIPEKFGHRVHEHTTDIKNAWKFDTKEKAMNYINGYTNPLAFWNSELEHKRRMQEKFRLWQFNVKAV